MWLYAARRILYAVPIAIVAMCFVATNLVVDLIQTAVDPRIKRS